MLDHVGKFCVLALIGGGLYYLYAHGWLSQHALDHDLLHLLIEAVH